METGSLATRTGSARTGKSLAEKKKVEFEYFAPNAKEVYVAGTFNNWKMDKTPLKKEKNGRWKVEVSLPAGRHEYRYIVDGAWLNDQRPVECVQNSFGSWNCVVQVG